MDANKIIPPSRFIKMPFFSRLTDVYPDSSMDWNDFFQFVIFFAFTPSVLHYYLLCTISYINPEKVTWRNIYELATLFSNECYLDLLAEELFEKLDITFHVWEPMYSFEMFIIELYIPTNIFIPIFERKLNYSLIKSYQINHSGNFPRESCLRFIKRMFTGLPHHYRFDYETGNCSGSLTPPLEDINVSDLLEIMIQRYLPMHRKQKIQYNLKYLTCFTAEKLLVSKGNFYHKIFTNLYNEHSLTKSNNTNTNNTTTNQNTGRSLLDMYSTNNNSNYNTTGNTSSGTGSILRSSSNYRDRSSSLFQRQHHHHPMDLTINTNLTNNDIYNNGSVRGYNCSFNTTSLTPKPLNNIIINNGNNNKMGMKGSNSNYKNDNSSILINNTSDSNDKKNSNKDNNINEINKYNNKKYDSSESENDEFSPKVNINPYTNNCAPSPPRYNNNGNGSIFINGSHRIKLSFQASALLSSSFNETPMNKNRKIIQTQSQSPQQQQPQHQSISQLQQNNVSIGSPLHNHSRVINVPGSIEIDIMKKSDDMI